MNIAVRYYSQFGRTKAIAEEMADELGVVASSVVDEPALKEHVDVLFLGGAPYLSIMDAALEEYVNGLTSQMVGCVVLFTTSNWSHRTAIGMRVKLEEQGIRVAPGHFYAHMAAIGQSKPAARAYAREALEKATKIAEAAEHELKDDKGSRVKELAVEVASVAAVAVVVVAGVAVARSLLKLRS